MKGTLPQRVRLGVFEVDLRAGELRQDQGAVLLLSDQPLQILRILIEADGQMVTREEIRQRLWPDDTVVEFDSSINNAIKKLRRAMVDSADEPHYIGTIAKRGYRLLVPVERVGFEEGGPVEPNQTAGPSTRPTTPTALGRDDTVDKSPSVGQIFAEPRRRSRWTWLAAGAILVGAVAVAAVFYWRAHRAPKLTERDTIVLADFDNKTGDPVFDDTLKQALTIQLEQSPFLNILSNRKVRQTLKLMNRSVKEPMTEDVTREVCLRSSSKAMVLGSVTLLGSQYVVGLSAVGCNLGEPLGEAQERASSKELVFNALDKAANRLRTGLGESLSSVEKYAMPLSQNTTPSIEALKAYTQGVNVAFAKGCAAALPLYNRAIDLDPKFAIGYYGLANCYANLGESGRAEENIRRAYDLRDRVSERERYTIEGQYYRDVTGELDKAAQAYQLYEQSYPRDYAAHGGLAVIYAYLGNLYGLLRESREGNRLRPDDSGSYINLAAAYVNLNQVVQGEKVYEEAKKRNLTGELMLQALYQIAFLKMDSTEMTRIANDAIGKPGVEDLLLATQADTAAYYGKFAAARLLTQRAETSAEHNEAKEAAANYRAAMAIREVAVGNRQLAHVDALAALRLSQTRDVKELAALVFAQAGDTRAAEKLADTLDGAYPVDTVIQHYWLPSIRAAVALEHGDPRGALQLLDATTPIELSVPPLAEDVYLIPAYVRGHAYLMLHDGKAAAAEFQKFIDHYGLITNFPWGALARLGLARAYALEAATDPAAREKARTAYQNFLTLWKDADPDIPIYQQAKAEYAKLQ